MKDNPSIRMIEIVAEGLRPLLQDIVFVGGATVGIYIDDPASPEPRPTNDVDCVIEITSRKAYYDLEKELRKLGFSHVQEAKAPICRWKFKSITVDVMPTDPKVLGFSNRWYIEAMKSAENCSLPNGTVIKIFTLPYFISSKMEAFLHRGQNDFRLSTDLEDIVSLLDGVQQAESILRSAPENIRSYLGNEFSKLVTDRRFQEAIEAHLPQVPGDASRFERIWSLLKALSANPIM
jgi:hypothetical protein